MFGHGCTATMVDGVNEEDNYVWSSLPQLDLQSSISSDDINDFKTVCIYGGYANAEKIQVFGELLGEGIPSDVRCWSITLTKPSQCGAWSPETSHRLISYSEPLVAIQHCHSYDLYFYRTAVFIVNNNNENMLCLCGIAPNHQFNRHVKSVFISDNIFIVNMNKMAKIENVSTLLSDNTDLPIASTHTIEFTVNVPHNHGTPFVIKEVLFILGGCDEDHEPYSEVHQYLPEVQEWKLIGLSTVSRYGASIVVITDKEKQQGVFVAGGFKGEEMPCTVIEKVSVIVENRGKKRTITEAALES